MEYGGRVNHVTLVLVDIPGSTFETNCGMMYTDSPSTTVMDGGTEKDGGWFTATTRTFNIWKVYRPCQFYFHIASVSNNLGSGANLDARCVAASHVLLQHQAKMSASNIA